VGASRLRVKVYKILYHDMRIGFNDSVSVTYVCVLFASELGYFVTSKLFGQLLVL